MQKNNFDAVMVLWYPGAEGGKAAARVLFGDVSPSGKLPVTFYNTLEELPDFTDYAMKGRTYRYMENKAQFPFGYGLTYGKVVVTDAVVRENSVADTNGTSVSGKAVSKAAIIPQQHQLQSRPLSPTRAQLIPGMWFRFT